MIANKGLGVGAVCLMYLVLLAVATAIFSPPLQNLLRDMMMISISPFTNPKPGIVVVAINEETLARLPYRSPIDRGLLTDILNRIQSGNPRAIGIDLLFDQPTEADKDLRLRSVLESFPAPVVLASGTKLDGLSSEQLDYLKAFSPRATQGLGTLLHDNLDRVVRGAHLGRTIDGEWAPSFPVAIAEAVGVDSGQGSREMVYYRDRNFAPFRFLVYPAQAVQFAPSSWFENKLVLLGLDLPQVDRHPTPFTLLNGADKGDLPGVIIHAHLLASILSGDRINTPGQIIGFAPFVAACAFSLWISWRSIAVIQKPIAIAAALAVVWVCAGFAFAWFAILIPLVAPSFIVVGLSSLVSFLAWRRDSKERQFVEGAFAKYVNPAVVTKIVREHGELRLGGERRVITSIFTDLEGFTGLSESVGPEEVASLLNEYLDRICDQFIEHGATIDKIVGDAVVGFFGAPAEQHDQADRAVALTLAIEGLGQKLHDDTAKRGLALGGTRIGVHAGPAIVGNFGGVRFFNYTAVGDTVNIAARLERANKLVGTKNCISLAVSKRTTGFLLRPIGVLYLKGKTEGVSACEALVDTQENRTRFTAYTKAYALAAAGDSTASHAFEMLAQTYPQDGLILFHQGRLAGGNQGMEIHLTGN
ncbi:adenylate cyclase [Sinorhizobium fredii]